jgi:hypothetical protein
MEFLSIDITCNKITKVRISQKLKTGELVALDFFDGATQIASIGDHFAQFYSGSFDVEIQDDEVITNFRAYKSSSGEMVNLSLKINKITNE